MVKDGVYYSLGFLLAAGLLGYFLPLPFAWLAVVPAVFAAFFLWFFRDPERSVPETPGLIVSPADGRVTTIAGCKFKGEEKLRISIFLNIFDVHVNRSPIGGVIRNVEYRKGKFGNAMKLACAHENEQNVVTVEDAGLRVTFSQIAGLLARRIVFNKSVGEVVERGERIGLIKFGSRVDLFLDPATQLTIKLGDHVKGASTIIGFLPGPDLGSN